MPKVYSNLAIETSDHFIEPASYVMTKFHANSAVVAYRFHETATLAAPNTLRLYSNGMLRASWLIEGTGGGGGGGAGADWAALPTSYDFTLGVSDP